MGVKANGMLRVNKVTSASMGYPLSVFNRKLYSQRVFQPNLGKKRKKERKKTPPDPINHLPSPKSVRL